jgi:uncharacterized protein
MPHYDDDLYVNLQWAPDADVEVLVTGWDNPLRYTQVPSEWNALPGMGEEHALVWTNRYGDGRVFASGIGHGPEAVSHPSFRGLAPGAASGPPPARSRSSCPRGSESPSRAATGGPPPSSRWFATCTSSGRQGSTDGHR